MKGPRVRSPPTQTERAVHELLPALRRDAVDAGPQDDIAHAPLEGDMAAVDVRRCGLGTGPPIAGMPRDELGAFASSPAGAGEEPIGIEVVLCADRPNRQVTCTPIRGKRT